MFLFLHLDALNWLFWSLVPLKQLGVKQIYVFYIKSKTQKKCTYINQSDEYSNKEVDTDAH